MGSLVTKEMWRRLISQQLILSPPNSSQRQVKSTASPSNPVEVISPLPLHTGFHFFFSNSITTYLTRSLANLHPAPAMSNQHPYHRSKRGQLSDKIVIQTMEDNIRFAMEADGDRENVFMSNSTRNVTHSKTNGMNPISFNPIPLDPS